jgi:hypothetical protein
LLTAMPAAAQDLCFSPDDPSHELRSNPDLPADAKPPIRAELPGETPILKLDVPLSVKPQSKPSSPNLSMSGGSRPSPRPATHSRLSVEAGIGFTLPNQPPVSVSATLIGTDSSGHVPVTVSTPRPFAADMRTPEREVGIAASYTIGELSRARVSLDGRLDVIRHSATDKPEQQGIGGFRVDF